MLEYKYQYCYLSDPLDGDVDNISITNFADYELSEASLASLSNKRGCEDVDGACDLKTFFS